MFKPDRFAAEIAGDFFALRKYKSFLRQLNIYGYVIHRRYIFLALSASKFECHAIAFPGSREFTMVQIRADIVILFSRDQIQTYVRLFLGKESRNVHQQ